MSKPVAIFSGSTGLNTRTDPSRITFDPKSGISDLAVAYNVDHRDSGALARISRRKGYSPALVMASAHSLWCKYDPCLFVSGTTLYRLNADYTYTSLATVTQGARVRYEQIGNQVYWVNGHEVGKVVGGAAESWTAGTYYGPETQREFSGPPAGHLICHHLGRLWIAQGPVAWYSEPFADNLFDLARGFVPFESRLRMIASAGNRALYFSDEKNTWVLTGNPLEAELFRVADYPAVEGTEAPILLGRIGKGELPGMGLIWWSAKGICIGTQDGLLFNLTERKVDLPSLQSGAGLVLDDRYIATFNP